MEEKNKLTKKIENLSTTLKACQEENEDLKINIQEMENLSKLNNKSKEEIIGEFEELKIKYLNLEANYRKSQNSGTQKDREI